MPTGIHRNDVCERHHVPFNIVSSYPDDQEVLQRPLPLAALFDAGPPCRGLVPLLKWALWQVLWAEPAPVGGWPPPAAVLRAAVKVLVGKLLGQLHDLNCRAKVMPTSAFHAEQLPVERLRAELLPGSKAEGSEWGRGWGVLRYAPFLVPFEERVAIFQIAVAADRDHHRYELRICVYCVTLSGFWRGMTSSLIMFPVSRRHVRVQKYSLCLCVGRANASCTPKSPLQEL